jgi:hypothetical protein
LILKSKTYRHALSLAASLILLFHAAPRADISNAAFTGLSSTVDSFNNSINEMKNLIEDIKKTFNSITFFFKKIGAFIDLIDLTTLLLFISVIFLSSGFSSIGVPRGIPAFFLSLFTADTVWILWEMSFGRGFSDIIPNLIKSNLIIFTPLLTIWIIRFFRPKAVSLIKKLYYFNKRASIPKSMIIDITGKIQNDWADFQKNLTKDLLASSGNNNVIISPETSEKIKSIKENLDNLSIKEKK